MAAGAQIGGSSTGVEPNPRREPERGQREAAFIQAGLARIIEGEILPRLARIHPRSRPPLPEPEPGEPAAAPPAERAVDLAHRLIERDPDAAVVDALLAEGWPLDTLLLDLLTPAARHVGTLWEEDEADFVAVTLALGRLHGLARALCERLETGAPSSGRRILLLPCPGETHRFSLALVASFFREAGWHVVLASAHDADPAALVRAEPFDLIGVSLSCDVLLPAMAALVADLRAASCNPRVRVLVGGPLFLRDPACAAAVGADATAEDGRSAVGVARALCEAG